MFFILDFKCGTIDTRKKLQGNFVGLNLFEDIDLPDLYKKITSLPEGYETVIGEQGSRFSGGERQRLSVARCLLKDTPIILLDEITSALDSINENQIMQLFYDLRHERTIIFITHRLHLNIWADKLLVLRKDGEVETGTHEDLVRNQDTRYHELWSNYLQSVDDAQTDDAPTLKDGVDVKVESGEKTQPKTEAGTPK